jgi:FG-GAP-like repeat
VVSGQWSVADEKPPRFSETDMPRKISSLSTQLGVFCGTVLLLNVVDAAGQEFDRVVIDGNFAGAYQVEVADVNGDNRPDVIAVGGGTCAWYENPSWKKRVVTGPKQTPGVISSATADFDGDGKAEIAIAFEFSMNEPKKGKLLLAEQGSSLDDPWTLVPLASIGSIHRLRAGDVDQDKRPDLVVASIFGPEAKPPDFAGGAELGVYRKPSLRGGAHPNFEKITSRPVMHAIDVLDIFKTGQACILTADDLGTSFIRWGKHSGGQVSDGWEAPMPLTAADSDGPPAKRGASEVHAGRMADGQCLLATIEPWHGNRVAVYLAAIQKGNDMHPMLGPFSGRTVLDESLADGHALWVADVDGDGDDEVFAGHRGKDHRVSMYDFDRSMNKWTRTVLDREIAAQDLRGGDLDGDGTPDVVAVGGSTHNVVWYRPRKK